MKIVMLVAAICLIPLSLGLSREEKKDEKKVCPTQGKCVKEGIMCIQSVAHTSTHHAECTTCKTRIPAGKCLKRNYCDPCATKAGICAGCGLALTEKGEPEKDDKEIAEALKQLESDDAEAVKKATTTLIDLAKKGKEAVTKTVEERKKRADVKCDIPREAEIATRCQKVLDELRWINEGKHDAASCCEKNAHIKPITTCGRCGKGTTLDGHKLCRACATEFKICYHCWKSSE